jgi:sensor histidine kinase YesM
MELSCFHQNFFLCTIHLLACYAFVYIVLPWFLQKKNYINLAAGILAISIFLVTTGYFIQKQLFPMMDAAYQFSSGTEKNTLLWNSISFGLLNAPKVIAGATIIKLLKRWWLKQKEKERLEKEKIDAELELLKAQIHPQFLFNSLNNIYSFALMSSPKSPEMLLKLSDILSYMLYECNDALVPLEKEIKMLKDYMSLEKTRYGDKLEMNIQVKGETDHQRIAPLLLLRFIENSFKQCSNKMIEQPWINLEINIEHEVFYMKLLNGKPMGLVSPGDDDEEMGQVKKRLQLLYPGRHEFKMVEEEEIFMVNLEIELETLQPPASPPFLLSKREEAVL